jgi:hypothetical protein
MTHHSTFVLRRAGPLPRTCAALGVAVAVLMGASVAAAQEAVSYRDFMLASTVESVVTKTGARASDVKTLHTRPAHVQELEWRAPYRWSGDTAGDPVRSTTFTFSNDALYQIVVTYDRTRTDGLTTKDLVDSVSTLYGPALPGSAKSLPAAYPDSTVLASWDEGLASVTLLRGRYATDVQLVLQSARLVGPAQTAIREAVRLDGLDSPRREREQREKEAADAAARLETQRTTNKAGFRP